MITFVNDLFACKRLSNNVNCFPKTTKGLPEWNAMKTLDHLRAAYSKS